MPPAVDVITHPQNFGFHDRPTGFLRAEIGARQEHLSNSKQFDKTWLMTGSLDLPTGLKAETHIFVADASDYYTIDDGLPQHDDYGTIHASE